MQPYAFCFACQKKNLPGAQRCEYCGALLVPKSNDLKTTARIFSKAPDAEESNDPCDDYLAELPEHSLALFVENHAEPILIHNSQTKFLGRLQKGTDPSMIDLSSYGAVDHGVSRFHARISFIHGCFKIEDLVSTNGTWLNDERLEPGKLYDLHHKDRIVLSHLPLSVCCREEEPSKTVEFELKRIPGLGTVPLQILTPYFLRTDLSNYLCALVDLYHACQACRGLPIEDAYISSVWCAELSPVLHVKMDAVGETIDLIQKWVMPWRQTHSGQALAGAADASLQAQLEQLAQNILEAIAPEQDPEGMNPAGMNPAGTNSFVEQLAQPLFTLATSELELSLAG